MRHKMRIMLLVLIIALFTNVTSVVVFAAPQAQQYATPITIVNTSFLNVRQGPGPQYPVLITVVGGTTLQVMGITADGTWLQVSTQAGLGWVDISYTLPRGNFQRVPVVSAPKLEETVPVTTTYSGNTESAPVAQAASAPSSQRLWGASVTTPQAVRAAPGMSTATIDNIGASDGIIYRVLDAAFVDGTPWVKLEFKNVTGWIDQNHVLFRPYGCGYTVVRITHDALTSAGPDGSGAELGIQGGHEVYLLDRVGNLFKLELQSGAVGWADVSFISIRDENAVAKPACTGGTASAAQNTEDGTGRTESSATSSVTNRAHVVVNTGYLNIRSGAGAQFETVASVPGGTRLAVVGRASDGVWYLVEGGFGRGWLNIEYAILRTRGQNIPLVSNTTGTVASPTGTFNGSITLYTAPNLSVGTVGAIQGPAGLTIIGQSSDGNWLQVSTGIGNGWVQRLLVTVSGNLSAVPVIP